MIEALVQPAALIEGTRAEVGAAEASARRYPNIAVKQVVATSKGCPGRGQLHADLSSEIHNAHRSAGMYFGADEILSSVRPGNTIYTFQPRAKHVVHHSKLRGWSLTIAEHLSETP